MRVDQGFVADPSEVLLDIRGAKPPCMDSSRGSGWRHWLGYPPPQRNAGLPSVPAESRPDGRTVRAPRQVFRGLSRSRHVTVTQRPHPSLGRPRRSPTGVLRPMSLCPGSRPSGLGPRVPHRPAPSAPGPVIGGRKTHAVCPRAFRPRGWPDGRGSGPRLGSFHSSGGGDPAAGVQRRALRERPGDAGRTAAAPLPAEPCPGTGPGLPLQLTVDPTCS